MKSGAHRRATTKAVIRAVRAEAYGIPTETCHSDGTHAWTRTVLVVARIGAGECEGLGYSYTHAGAADVVNSTLADCLVGRDADAIPACVACMRAAVRNFGREGIAACAISAVDVALWDLKARRMDRSLAQLLGSAREAVTAYGSGGFTSAGPERLEAQLADWQAAGLTRIKIKVGREPGDDPERVALVRERLGPDVAIMVDANGAWETKLALHHAQRFAELGVDWLEEPVSSRDLRGLRLLRERAPAPVRIAAGEYGWHLGDFLRLLEAGAVDVLQADATRCGGVTGFLAAGALCEAFERPLSSHTAPALHAPLCCAVLPATSLEYYVEHVRIERELFDGVPELCGGRLSPPLDRPGLGLKFREREAAEYRLS